MANYDSIINFNKSKFNTYGEIVEAVIKDGVMTIGDWAFLKCYSLTHITIPDSVTSVGSHAFEDCTSLKNYKNRYFKITNSDMSCLKRHYKMNKWYYLNSKPVICEHGFHACTRPADCFNYYSGDVNELRFFEVELGDKIVRNMYDSKVCSNKIKFIKEYTFKEFIELANNS